jgi:raffinose/stachyose/melibiose transport system permease protein
MKKNNAKSILIFFSMVGPGLVIYLFIVAFPVFYSLWMSFTSFNPNAGGAWSFVGGLHYLTMLADPQFWHAFKNGMIVVAVSVFGQIPIGFVLAYILFRKTVRARNFFQAMVFLPQFLSTIVVGTLWKRLMQADGPIARLIQMVSGNPNAQFDAMLKPETVMVPIGFVLIWMYTGLYMMILLANLQKIDDSVIEAAQIDGASESKIFVRVIVPLLMSSVVVCTILAIAGSLRGFDLIFAMTTRGLSRQNAMVLPIFMYQTAFDDYGNPMRFAYGSAISNSIVFISVTLILASNFIGRKLGAGEEN